MIKYVLYLITQKGNKSKRQKPLSDKVNNFFKILI